MRKSTKKKSLSIKDMDKIASHCLVEIMKESPSTMEALLIAFMVLESLRSATITKYTLHKMGED